MNSVRLGGCFDMKAIFNHCENHFQLSRFFEGKVIMVLSVGKKAV